VGGNLGIKPIGSGKTTCLSLGRLGGGGLLLGSVAREHVHYGVKRLVDRKENDDNGGKVAPNKGDRCPDGVQTLAAGQGSKRSFGRGVQA